MKIICSFIVALFLGFHLGYVVQGVTIHHSKKTVITSHTKKLHHHRKWVGYLKGKASWYGCGGDLNLCPWGDDKTQGRPTSSGVIFDTHKAMCASWYYPLHSWVVVKNPKTHKSTACQILDRGPNVYLHRVIDLSHYVKSVIGMRGGLGTVAVYSKTKPKLVADAF
jgi:rare lipoprotein A (peptidoglycan hydrolase)